jgi:hypothetical protein
VPEVFSDPEQLYTWLAWGTIPGEVPSFAEVRPILERIFAEHAAPHAPGRGVVIRRRRDLWRAIVPA